MIVSLQQVRLPLAHYELDVTLEMSLRSTAIVGPSGAGKTSLLEIIAGLRRPRQGTVSLNGRIVHGQGVHVPARQRHTGYVPQDDALFPHLSVRRNILFGARGDDDPHVVEVLEIGHLLERSVHDLSGGERKRVALARALRSGPEILLLDEPLTGMDLDLRQRVLRYLLRVRDEFPIPLIMVTHQTAEAEALCQEIVMMERGRITGSRRA